MFMDSKAKEFYNAYMREYMKGYRKTKEGKKICKEAKERYYAKKSKEGKKEEKLI